MLRTTAGADHKRRHNELRRTARARQSPGCFRSITRTTLPQGESRAVRVAALSPLDAVDRAPPNHRNILKGQF